MVSHMQCIGVSICRLAAIVALATVLVGCGSGADRVVDGWPIGAELDCSTELIGRVPKVPCDVQFRTFIRAATDAIDRRDPGHPAIVRVTLHQQSTTAVDAFGHEITRTTTGTIHVARFDLADGSVRAIGIGILGIGPDLWTGDYGPGSTATPGQ